MVRSVNIKDATSSCWKTRSVIQIKLTRDKWKKQNDQPRILHTGKPNSFPKHQKDYHQSTVLSWQDIQLKTWPFGKCWDPCPPTSHWVEGIPSVGLNTPLTTACFFGSTLQHHMTFRTLDAKRWGSAFSSSARDFFSAKMGAKAGKRKNIPGLSIENDLEPNANLVGGFSPVEKS